MSFWIFQSNPKNYRLRDALLELDRIDWRVRPHQREVKAGDGVLVWESGDEAGVYAVGEVLTDPVFGVTPVDPYDIEVDSEARWYTSLRITHRMVDRPVLRSQLRDDPELHELRILRFAHATTFPVTEKEWARILLFAGIDWKPTLAGQDESPIRILEVPLTKALADSLSTIEEGLEPLEERVALYPTPVGEIDLLCRDKAGTPVVVELKRDNWENDKAVGQTARYMGWVKEIKAEGGRVRGILLIMSGGNLPEKLKFAMVAIPDLEVRKYSVKVDVQKL